MASIINKDAVGELQNIMMGASATALSTMLSLPVSITTPCVNVISTNKLDYSDLEPVVHVRVDYVQGIEGSSVMLLRRNDVQLLLKSMMGMPLELDENFEFDEMALSMTCEMMNQMMGASATALSSMIAECIDISVPIACTDSGVLCVRIDEDLCEVVFRLQIKGVMDSKFMSIIPIPLAMKLVRSTRAKFTENLCRC